MACSHRKAKSSLTLCLALTRLYVIDDLADCFSCRLACTCASHQLVDLQRGDYNESCDELGPRHVDLINFCVCVVSSIV
jgi:hypothetical protein